MVPRAQRKCVSCGNLCNGNECMTCFREGTYGSPSRTGAQRRRRCMIRNSRECSHGFNQGVGRNRSQREKARRKKME